MDKLVEWGMKQLDVYPFQRMTEPTKKSIPRSNKKVGKKNLKVKLPVWFGSKTGQQLLHTVRQHIWQPENLFLFFGAVIFSRAFILGELLPYIYAFVVAFGCRSPVKLVVLCLSAIVGMSTFLTNYAMWSNILTLTILGLVLYWQKISLEKIIWGIPLLTSASIFIVKTLLLLSQGWSLYGVMVIVFEALLSGILAFMALTVAAAFEEKKSLPDYTFEDRTSLVVMGMGLIIGLMGIEWWDLNLGSIFCRLSILLAAFVWGSGGGTMVGVGAGFIPSLTSAVLAESIGMYAISGLLAGLFRAFGVIGSIVGFMLGVLGFSLFSNDTQATINGMWETCIAAVLFLVVLKLLGTKNDVQSLGNIKKISISEPDRPVVQPDGAALARIHGLADVFEELSSTFMAPSYANRSEQGSTVLDFLYEAISNDFCQKCSRCGRCWGKDAHITSREIMDLFAMVEAKGELSYQDCSLEYKRMCIKGKEMVREINRIFDTLRINEYWSDKYQQSQDLVSMQLKGVSKVIRQLTDELGKDMVLDGESKKNILAALKRLGVKVYDIIPFGHDQQPLYLQVNMQSCKNREQCDKVVTPVLSSYWDEDLMVCEKRCPPDRQRGLCQAVISRRHNFVVHCGSAQVSKEGICGDSFTIATLSQGKELIALSDGMGVGESAYGESQTAIRLLENLLSKGFEKEVALKTINSVLMLRSSRETFATLDMLMVDLYNGEADFIKVGSSPAFIKNGSQVETIMASSLPIGILDSIDMVSERRQLSPGNMVILISDGVMELSHNRDRDLWVPEFLAYISEQDPQRAADMIINKALAICKGRPADDMTVICARIDLA